MIVGIFSPSENIIVSQLQDSEISILPLLRSNKNCEDIKFLNPDIIICRNRDNISQFVSDCSNLKMIFIIEVGLEKLPFKDLISHNVRVANTSGISADIMSNYSMACILNHVTNFEEDLYNSRNHYWKKYQCTNSLFDRTLLVVGAGRTGTAIAKKAKVFGMKTLGVVKHKRDIDFFDEIGTMDDLNQYLGSADFVICTLPLTPETRYLFNKDKFCLMKQNAVFINISRGALVNDIDLLNAIDSGLIAKAYLDVFEVEPLPDNHVFWDNPKIIVTPHQSGRLENHFENAINIFLNNYRAYQQGTKMPNEVNLDQGY